MSHLSEEQLDQIIAAEKARQHEPLNEWRTIAARAREEGLIHDSREWRGSLGQQWLQAAAAVLLLVGGIAIGRSTIGLPVAQTEANIANPSGSINPATLTPASSRQGTIPSAEFASVDEASAALDSAVRAYQHASQYIAANNLAERTRDSAAIYRARAEALDQIANAARS